MQTRKLFSILILIVSCAAACRKSNTGTETTPAPDYKLSYGDSVLYLKNSGGTQIVSPVTPMRGEYESFPDGLEIDEETGDIDLSNSETGLRYRITFTPAEGGQTYTTMVLVAGVNYLDKFHFLSKNDTLSKAVYNADLAKQVPVSSGKTVFDVDLGCNKEGIAIDVNTGTINLAETIRRGFFGKHPDNEKRDEFELKYKIDDKSGRATNSIKIKLYYYNTLADVPEKYFELLEEREGTILWANNTHSPAEEISGGATGIAGVSGQDSRPRPPCIFIIGR
jgi:hypothetical protein